MTWRGESWPIGVAVVSGKKLSLSSRPPSRSNWPDWSWRPRPDPEKAWRIRTWNFDDSRFWILRLRSNCLDQESSWRWFHGSGCRPSACLRFGLSQFPDQQQRICMGSETHSLSALSQLGISLLPGWLSCSRREERWRRWERLRKSDTSKASGFLSCLFLVGRVV